MNPSTNGPKPPVDTPDDYEEALNPNVIRRWRARIWQIAIAIAVGFWLVFFVIMKVIFS